MGVRGQANKGSVPWSGAEVWPTLAPALKEEVGALGPHLVSSGRLLPAESSSPNSAKLWRGLGHHFLPEDELHLSEFW